MTPYTLHQGDCRDVMAGMDADSVDAIVCDPPYGLGFMGKGWDHGVPGVEFWQAAKRVAKPGAHLLAFGGTRTFHRLTVAIEDAGWEIRDTIMWVYGSGFPKSLDVSKAIDAAAGAEREVVGSKHLTGMTATRETFGADDRSGGKGMGFRAGDIALTAPATPEAQQWQGWGTALKPAWEPIIVARKPLVSSAINVMEVVELNLRERGVTGAISWIDEHVSDAAKSRVRPSLSSTEAPPRQAETFAANAVESATRNAEQRIGNSFVPIMPGGELPIANISRDTPSVSATNSETKSFEDMAGGVSVAGSLSAHSSHSITSTGGEAPTAERSTAKYTSSLEETDSQTATAFFAGIATGLTGSMAHVLIKRNSAGEFEWPNGLPRKVPAQSLTVASNVLRYGTGGINVDACRIGTDTIVAHGGGINGAGRTYGQGSGIPALLPGANAHIGRWPANLIHDGSEDVVGLFPESDGSDQVRHNGAFQSFSKGAETARDSFGFADSGSAARFFYTAKASREDREEGLESLPLRSAGEATDRVDGSAGLNSPRAGASRTNGARNHHPTVKPTSLMRYLCRLVTPRDGIVLDPFMGSGSTGKAAILEGFRFIGIDLEPEYVEIARARCEWAMAQPRQLALEETA